ncbi:MAG: hypothetical protein WCP85_09230 [Mariniphaga sp.]
MNALKDKKNQLIVIFLGLLYAAITYWPVFYMDINMVSRTFFIIWFSGALVIGCISVIFCKNEVLRSAAFVTIGFVLAVVLRIVYDSIGDANSHNLAGIEVVIAVFYTFLGGLVGAIIGRVIQKKNAQKS